MSLSLWPFRRRRTEPIAARPTLLVAEEDPQIRALLQGFLGEVGFATRFVEDGAAALELIERSSSLPLGDPERVNAVLVDVEALHRSGLDILVTVRRKGWQVPVILTSLYVSTMLRSEGVRMGAAAVLRKPLSLPELEQVLQRVMASSGGRRAT